MEYRVFSKDGNQAMVVSALHGPEEAVAIANAARFKGSFAIQVSGAEWGLVQYYQAGGVEPFHYCEVMENAQFSLQALACGAPDTHGAFMDAPASLGRGVYR